MPKEKENTSEERMSRGNLVSARRATLKGGQRASYREERTADNVKGQF